MIGNLLEWYDSAIYGYFAAQIGRQFFPHEQAVAQLLSTFGVFAVGFLAGPLGGAAPCLGRVRSVRGSWARTNGQLFASLPNSQRQLRPLEDSPHRYNEDAS
jgi:MFS family permease